MNRSNTIYYRFKSEKKKYSINFDTTEISIADIKKEIIKRRNMEKVPEKFELIFYDENNNELRDENYKVEPLKLLNIKRIPWYKLSNTFIEVIHDPSEISSLRFSDFVITARKSNQITMVNFIDPLEKIQHKLSNETLLKIFGCKICQSVENDPVILNCCGETICEKCANEKDFKCMFCEEIGKGHMPNKKIKELRDRAYMIMNKAIMQSTQIEDVQISQENISGINTLTQIDGKTKGPLLPQLVPIQGQQVVAGVSSSLSQNYVDLNPSNVFFENARYFIIKSSNKENVDLSQKYSEWATTVTNQKKLNEAFQNNNVILIFSVNKSGSFQGYAIMTSFISDKVSNIWQNESSVKLGGSFSIHWLSMCELPFNKVKNLVNPINNNESVIKSRDTQELPKDIGITLCNLCWDQEKFENSYKSIKPVYCDPDIINKINEDVKKSREKYFQRQPPVVRPVGPPSLNLASNPSAHTIPQSYPWPYMMNPYMYHTGVANVDMSMYPRMPYMYPGVQPAIHNLPSMPHPMQLVNIRTDRERSRGHSHEKSVKSARSEKTSSSKKSGSPQKSHKSNM